MKSEPVLTAFTPVGLLSVVLAVLSAFHVFTPDASQVAALSGAATFLTLAGAWFARRRVTPNAQVFIRTGDILPPKV